GEGRAGPGVGGLSRAVPTGCWAPGRGTGARAWRGGQRPGLGPPWGKAKGGWGGPWNWVFGSMKQAGPLLVGLLLGFAVSAGWGPPDEVFLQSQLGKIRFWLVASSASATGGR